MNIIRAKIDKFIRKYYINKILSGIIILFGISVVLILVSVFIEYFTWLNSTWRAVLFWTTISIASAIFIFLVLVPILKLFRLGKIISYPEAAKIIGKFFPEIRDKLLNYLQLEEMQESSSENYDLIVSSIRQKTESLKPLNFSGAITFKSAKKYLLYFLPPALILLLILLIKPVIIKTSTERIVNYKKEFVKPQAYYIKLLNQHLSAIENEDFTVSFAVSGDESPNYMKIVFNSGSQNTFMTKVNDSTYNYTFKRVQKDITFFASSDRYNSSTFTLKVMPKPVLLGFKLTVDFPDYTRKENETTDNTGIINVLYGSRGFWQFFAKDTDGIIIFSDDSCDTITTKNANNAFGYTSRFRKNENINVVSFNSHLLNNDTLKYEIRITDDLSPDIQVVEQQDSLSYKNLYFAGTISDDFGFSSLSFNYRIFQSSIPSGDFKSVDIPFDKSASLQKFYWGLNIDDIDMQPGDAVEFFFEVCDNDTEKGFKCNSSDKNTFNRKTVEEINEESAKTRDEFKKDIQTNLNELDNIKNDIDEFLLSLKEKENLTFQDKEKLQNLLEKQQSLQNSLEKQIESMSLDQNTQNEINPFNENILKKQEQIQEMFNRIMDEDMKKLISDLQKMLEDFNKDNLDQQMREYKMSSEDIEKELDQTLDLFKRLEFEQEFNKAIGDLDSLSKELKKLAEETSKTGKDSLNNLADKQKKIADKFDKLKENFDKLNDLNQSLKDKQDIDFNDMLQEDISKDLESAKDNLNKKDKKGAEKDQKSGAENMDKLSESLQMQIDLNFGEQQEEDIENIRRLLENVIQLSFKEEMISNKVKTVKIADPQYVNLILEQNEANGQIKLVEDSLAAIASRNFSVSMIIFDELKNLKSYSSESTKNLSDRNINNAAINLQRTMQSLNQLALLLSESIDKMEEEDSGMCSSSCPNGKKKKAGKSGKPSLSTIKQLQQQLNDQMKQMQKDMKEGSSSMPFGKKPSESFARLAAEQEAIRHALEEMQKDLRSEGGALDGSLQEAIKGMEMTETDLINKRLSEAMIKRQNEIMTRLLNSEKAERERGKDEKRESKTAKQFSKPSPEEFFNKDKTAEGFDNVLKTIPPDMNEYYRKKVEQYRYDLEND